MTGAGSKKAHRRARPSSPGRAPALATWTPAIAIVSTFAAMLSFSWGKWPDVLMDFGHELYGPWQISQGKVLARDIAWGASGPLSPYWNGFLFWLFGPSLLALVAFNATVLASFTALLYATFRSLADRMSATAACLVFLTVFAFGQYIGNSNSTFIAPYSHGATHGVTLSVLCIFLLYRHLRDGRPRDLALAGACYGLVFLTKPEIFVACSLAVSSTALLVRRGHLRLGTLLRALPFAGAALIPPLAAFLLLLVQLPPGLALRATAGPWFIMATPMTRTPFYLQGLGIDDPVRNVEILLIMLIAFVIIGIVAAVLDRILQFRAAPWAAAIMVLALGGSMGWLPLTIWRHAASPLPVFALAGVAVYGFQVRQEQGAAAVARPALGLMLSAFAGGLLLKMALNARVYQYGFVLAMPAFLLFVTWSVSSIPAALRSRGGAGTTFRAIACALAAVFAVTSILLSSRSFSIKTERVGSGADAFMADTRGLFVNAVLAYLRRIPPEATIAVIPEGVMINYLSRRTTPSKYLATLPDAELAFGEDALLDQYRRHPPNLILVVHRAATEHGAALFGRDYGLKTMAWISSHYVPVAQFGSSPFEYRGYGMLLFADGQTPLPAAGATVPHRAQQIMSPTPR